MEAEPSQVFGLVLCRAGPHRLAFLPEEIAAIEASTSVPCPYAREAYALPPIPGRVLFTESGPAITVDTLEVSQEALQLMPIPSMVQLHAGGSLQGFVSTREALWPVLNLPEFSRFLARRA